MITNALPITLSNGTVPSPNRLSAEFPRLSPMTNSWSGGTVCGGKSAIDCLAALVR